VQKKLPWIFLCTDTVIDFKLVGEHKCTISIIKHLTYQNIKVHVLNSFDVSWNDTKIKYEDKGA